MRDWEKSSRNHSGVVQQFCIFVEKQKATIEFLEDELWAVVSQEYQDADGVYSTCAMSSRVPLMEHFIKKGILKEVSRSGRLIDAVYNEEYSPG